MDRVRVAAHSAGETTEGARLPGGAQGGAWHPIEATESAMVAEVLRRVVRDELRSVRAALSDMREELQCRLPLRGESECRRPAPSGKLLPPMVPLHLPPELPGMPPEEPPGLAQEQAPSLRDDTPHCLVGAPRSVGNAAHLGVVDADPRPARFSNTSGPRTSCASFSDCDVVGNRTSRASSVQQALALDAGCVRKRAEDVKRRTQAVKRNTISLHDGEQPRILMTRAAETFLHRTESEQDGSSVPRGSAFSSIRGESGPLSRPRREVLRVVHGMAFDVFVCTMLLANAILIGVQANRSASKADATQAFRVIEVFFCVFFTAELLLRLYAYRCQFFRSGDWWNYFDLMLVLFQLVDELTIAIVGSTGSQSFMKDMSVVRLVRVLRLLRILRLLRVIRFVTELRKVIYLIMGSLPSFFWTMVLLTLLVYILAVFFTQIVADSMDEWGPGASEQMQQQEALRFFFGSTLLSTLTLYKAVTGGVDWQDISTPVFELVSPFAGLMFIFFNAFAVLVLLNLVTGVFVDGAMKLSRADKEMELLEKAYKLFQRTDEDGSGDITWDEFQSRLESPEMSEFFEALEISSTRADDLFQLIDRSQDGKLSLEELVAGGLMLQGPAKAIDVAALMKYVQVTLDSLRSDVLSSRMHSEIW